MNELVDKQQVRRGFASGLPTYHKQAVAQRQIADRLFALAQPFCPRQSFSALELGCGTGFLTERLSRLPQLAHLHLNDLVPQARELVAPLLPDALSWDFRAEDAEQMPLPEGLGVLFSASTLQWFKDLPAFLDRVADALPEGSVLACSTFGPDNLRELRALGHAGLDYPDLQDWEQLLSSRFSLQLLQQEHIALQFDSPLQVLRHLQQTGVNGLPAQHWTRERLQHFEQAYCQAFARQQGGVPLTYHPIYFVATKHTKQSY